MNRATISATFPELSASRAEIRTTAVASNREAAIARAVRVMFDHPSLHGKKISTIKATISLTTLSMRDVEAAMQEPEQTNVQAQHTMEPLPTTPPKPEPIHSESAAEADDAPAPTQYPDGKYTVCRYCGTEIEGSYARHLATCPKKGKAVVGA